MDLIVGAKYFEMHYYGITKDIRMVFKSNNTDMQKHNGILDIFTTLGFDVAKDSQYLKSAIQGSSDAQYMEMIVRD